MLCDLISRALTHMHIPAHRLQLLGWLTYTLCDRKDNPDSTLEFPLDNYSWFQLKQREFSFPPCVLLGIFRCVICHHHTSWICVVVVVFFFFILKEKLYWV